MPSADRVAATDADFYLLEQSLEPGGRQLLHQVREFMEKSVQPVINHYWTREEFPHDLVGGLHQLGIAGVGYSGYGCPGGGCLLDGMIAMELARVDSSIATYFGVHSGLAMGSIYLCGSEEQKERWLPEMARMEKIGAFGLTEPDVGSGAAGGLTTTARRGVAGVPTVCARGAYEHALAYAGQRSQFGRPIAGFQLVQDLLVRMLANVTSSACLCARLAALQQEGLAEDHHSALAKAFCTVRMREAAGWARELLGGNGILLENHVGRFVADSEAIYSYEGTREINTLIVGRAITGLGAFV